MRVKDTDDKAIREKIPVSCYCLAIVPMKLKLLPALGCFLLGGVGCLLVLSAVDHPAFLGPNATAILFGGMVASMALWGTAFFLFLCWRDRYAPPNTPRWSIFFYPAAQIARRRFQARALLADRGVHGLEPGATYRVIKAFTDYYKNRFEMGTELAFIRSNFIPYHGGTTLQFSPRNIYLQDEVNSDILGHLDDYLERVDPPRPPGHQPPPLPPGG